MLFHEKEADPRFHALFVSGARFAWRRKSAPVPEPPTGIFVMLFEVKFITHMYAPSKAMPSGPVPTA